MFRKRMSKLRAQLRFMTRWFIAHRKEIRSIWLQIVVASSSLLCTSCWHTDKIMKRATFVVCSWGPTNMVGTVLVGAGVCGGLVSGMCIGVRSYCLPQETAYHLP